ncbi:MAG: response regulator [Planctomycetes bacterium]|nr:response regulator [Planctomycetota bacterium]
MARILIVEDEAHIARVMSLWLSRHGHQIREATNGRAALDVLGEESFDLIISDMNMPEMNGLDLVAAVRKVLCLEVPFMLLSARCDLDNLDAQLKPYSVRLYPKPFVPSRLVSDIERMLSPVPT